MPRRSEITLWQLTVLLKAAELEGKSLRPDEAPPTLSTVAADLGVSRQQVVGALERLEEHVEGSIVEELDDGLKVRRTDLVRLAQKISDDFAQFDRAARESKGRWWLRLDGYWAHLSAFLADAAKDLEQGHPEAYVELSPQFGESRAHRGGGLTARVANGEIDLCVAPSRSPLAPGLRRVVTHRAVLLAAVHERHELAGAPGDVVDVSELLAGAFPLLVSPRGHASRTLLEQREHRGQSFNVEVTGPEPAALVALQSGRRVAVVSSDSIFPPQLAGGDGGWMVPSHWPALVDADKLIGTEYAIFHRTHVPKERRSQYGSTRFVPPNVATWLSQIADSSRLYAERRLLPRVEKWSDRDLAA